MSQPVTSSRLTNSAVNINGATTAVITNYGLARIGVTGNSFDISSSSGNVTLGITGTGNVQIGNATSGTVSLPGVTTFASLNGATTTSTINIGSNLTTGGIVTLGSTTSTTNLYGTLDVANIEGPTAGSAMTIGNNITSGSVSIGNAGRPNTVTIGHNGAGATGTVNLGVSASVVNISTTGPGNVTIGNTGVLTVNCSLVNMSNNSGTYTMVNIGNTGTSPMGDVNVGRGATNINIGGNVASAITLGRSTGSVTLGPPLTLGAAPSSSQTSCLGCIITNTIADTTTISQSTVFNIKAYTVVTTGIYYVYYNIQTNSSVTITVFQAWIQNNSGGQIYGSSAINASQSASGPFISAINGSAIISLTAGDSWALKCLFASTGTTTTNNSYFNFVRIA